MTSNSKKATTWAAITYQSKSQLMHHHIGIHLLITPGTNLIRPREVSESTLEAALGSADFSGLTSASDIEKHANFIVTAISTEGAKAITKSKSERSESNPISDETVALIKEKIRLRRQCSEIKGSGCKDLH